MLRFRLSEPQIENFEEGLLEIANGIQEEMADQCRNLLTPTEQQIHRLREQATRLVELTEKELNARAASFEADIEERLEPVMTTGKEKLEALKQEIQGFADKITELAQQRKEQVLASIEEDMQPSNERFKDMMQNQAKAVIESLDFQCQQMSTDVVEQITKQIDPVLSAINRRVERIGPDGELMALQVLADLRDRMVELFNKSVKAVNDAELTIDENYSGAPDEISDSTFRDAMNSFADQIKQMDSEDSNHEAA